MKTRTITNSGDPLVDGSGNPIIGAKVSFTLLGSNGEPTDAWDTVSGERIAPQKVWVLTDSNGEFSIPLWPTSRGDRILYWLCNVNSRHVEDIIAPLVDGIGDLQWADFKASGDIPQDLPAFGISVQNGLPMWNGQPWPGSGGGHIVVDSAGTSYPQRSKLRFNYAVSGSTFSVSVTDDQAHDTTIVTITFPDTISGGTF